MERVYRNNRPGERRIHVEIPEDEIADLVTDLSGMSSATGTRLLMILENTREFFTTGVDRQMMCAGPHIPGTRGRWANHCIRCGTKTEEQ